MEWDGAVATKRITQRESLEAEKEADVLGRIAKRGNGAELRVHLGLQGPGCGSNEVIERPPCLFRLLSVEAPARSQSEDFTLRIQWHHTLESKETGSPQLLGLRSHSYLISLHELAFLALLLGFISVSKKSHGPFSHRPFA